MKFERVTPDRKCDNCNNYAVEKLKLKFARGVLLCGNCKEELFDLVKSELNVEKITKINRGNQL